MSADVFRGKCVEDERAINRLKHKIAEAYTQAAQLATACISGLTRPTSCIPFSHPDVLIADISAWLRLTFSDRAPQYLSVLQSLPVANIVNGSIAFELPDTIHNQLAIAQTRAVLQHFPDGWFLRQLAFLFRGAEDGPRMVSYLQLTHGFQYVALSAIPNRSVAAQVSLLGGCSGTHVCDNSAFTPQLVYNAGFDPDLALAK